MRQKLSLACALVHTPRVLFLDEPTNGVDPVSRRDLWQILRRFAQQGVTVVVSTAYLDEAERCTRLALVHRGALLAAGTPAEVRGLMRGALCEVRAPDARRAAGALRAALPQGAVNLFGDRVHVVTRDGEDAAAGAALVGRTLARAGVATESVRPLSPSLEDVFVSLLARREPGEAAAMEPAGASAPAPVEDSAAPAIAVRDLEKRFGSFTAVRRVSLELRRGEIFGLLGPNGAGKSTTLRMLCGILAPSGGTGTVAGFDLRAEPERVKARIGYMSQKFSLYGELTVEENLNFYGGIYGLDPARKAGRKAWVLAMAGLQAQRRTRVEQLPTGWKQRLALGCAILHEPSVVFLDEPTSGVDPISRRRFWDLIHALAGGGVTTLVTTHHMDEAEYCNRVALIYGGERIALGTPSELKQAALDHPAATMEEVFLALVEARDRSAPQTPEVRR
jgi:ABC-2 type transport system ATP-binding protein